MQKQSENRIFESVGETIKDTEKALETGFQAGRELWEPWTALTQLGLIQAWQKSFSHALAGRQGLPPLLWVDFWALSLEAMQFQVDAMMQFNSRLLEFWLGMAQRRGKQKSVEELDNI